MLIESCYNLTVNRKLGTNNGKIFGDTDNAVTRSMRLVYNSRQNNNYPLKFFSLLQVIKKLLNTSILIFSTSTYFNFVKYTYS